MPNTLHARIGPRDLELLTAIDRFPVTSAQLCRISLSFKEPFRDENNLRRRLRSLTLAGFVRSFPYAVASEGRSPRYFKLTREGYRFLYGSQAAMPKRRYFQEIRPGHHHHTLSIAELMTHLIVCGHRLGHTMQEFARENSVRLQVTVSDVESGDVPSSSVFTVFPDCAFVVRRADGSRFAFCVELDNGSERVRSTQDVESIERKLRAYDAHQSQYSKFDPNRYLVLFVTTRSDFRVSHILQLANAVMLHPGRTVFLGASLSAWLRHDPFKDAILSDHRGLKRTLVPMATKS